MQFPILCLNFRYSVVTCLHTFLNSFNFKKYCIRSYITLYSNIFEKCRSIQHKAEEIVCQRLKLYKAINKAAQKSADFQLAPQCWICSTIGQLDNTSNSSFTFKNLRGEKNIWVCYSISEPKSKLQQVFLLQLYLYQ